MNYRHLTTIALIAVMLGMILPLLPASSHVPCNTKFAVKVNGELTWIDEIVEDPYPMTELTYGLDTEFTVEVWILNVKDLYGYEFELHWDCEDYFELSGFEINMTTWPHMFCIDFLKYKMTMPYKQVCFAVLPSTGVSGNLHLATLTFTIIEDVCLCEGTQECMLWIENYKASDSCTQKIPLCDDLYATVEYSPAAPDILMKPNNETNSAIWPYDGKFTKEIWVSDIVKMKSLHFDLRWNKWEGADMVELEYVEYDKVNLAHMDPALSTPVKSIVMKNVTDDNTTRSIVVDIFIKCDADPLRGTFRVMTLTFKKTNPWPCGKQPEYTYRQPHEWTPENATCKFYFYKGYFDVTCGGEELNYIYFGSVMNPACGTLVEETWSGAAESYGEAEWIDAYSGGCSVNLTTYITDDFAGVDCGCKDILSVGNFSTRSPTFVYMHNPGPWSTDSSVSWLHPTSGMDFTPALDVALTPAQITAVSGFGGPFMFAIFNGIGGPEYVSYNPIANLSPVVTADPTTTITGVQLQFTWRHGGVGNPRLWINDGVNSQWVSLVTPAGGVFVTETFNLLTLPTPLADNVAKVNALRIELWANPGGANWVDIDLVRVVVGYDQNLEQRCGPRLAIGLNATAWAGQERIAISDAPIYSTTWANFTPSTWYVYNWDGQNMSTVIHPAGYWGTCTWVQLGAGGIWGWSAGTATNVTSIMIYMGIVNSGVPAGLTIDDGSAVVDYLLIEWDHPVPSMMYNVTWDFEPPCQTSKWYDPDLYDLTQEYIVNLYTFMPVPGDLNRDGMVDITDILIIAQQYGKPNDYYDFNDDGIVDIFDIVVVTKNYGRTEP